MRPCFGCTKELLQARVSGVYYLHEWRHPDESCGGSTCMLQARFSGGVRRIDVHDPDAAWATCSPDA
jgi:dCMP deaminase